MGDTAFELNDAPVMPAGSPRRLLLQLPIELIQKVIEAIDGWNSSARLGSIRLTCRKMSSFVTPRFLQRVRVIPHLYYLDRLAIDIKSGSALSEHLRELVLDTHSAVNVAAMFIDAYRMHGVIPGLIETHYVQPKRNEIDCQLETDALLGIFESLRNLQSVTLIMRENHDPARPDPWAVSWRFSQLREALQIPEWSEYDHLHRQNWHFETPSMATSILHALHQFPKLKKVKFSSLNLARLGCAALSTSQSLAQIVNAVISELDQVSFNLVIEDDDSFEYEPEFENFTDGPGSLLSRLENCTNLRMSFQHGWKIKRKFEIYSFGDHFTRLHPYGNWSIMPKLESIFLGNIVCEPHELLRILTDFYPCLKSVALCGVKIAYLPSIEDSQRTLAQEWHEAWTRFLKGLRARTKLESLWFCGLFVPSDLSVKDINEYLGLSSSAIIWSRNESCVNDESSLGDFEQAERIDPISVDLDVRNKTVSSSGPRAGGVPELYTKTIAWFHDKSLGDDECPLNDFEQADELRRFFCDGCTNRQHTCYGRHEPRIAVDL